MSLLDAVKSMEDRFSFKKQATVGGITFGISLLNYEQDQMINSIPDEGDDPLTFYDKTRAQVLSYAITSIDNEKIPDIVEVKDGDKPVTKERPIYVRELLKKIPPKIVEKLFEIYIDFKEETDKKLEDDVMYQWYKTPEQRQKEREQKEEEDHEEEINEEGNPEEENDVKEDEEKPIVFTEVKVQEEDTDTNPVG